MMVRKKLDKNFTIALKTADGAVRDKVPMTVPGSAISAYLDAGLMPDPYDRDNEYLWTDFLRNDFVIDGSFDVTAEEMGHSIHHLLFHGIDTVADIFLNGVKLGSVNNMHRSYEFPVDGIIKEGVNTLTFQMESPIRYVEEVVPEKGHEITMVNTGTLPGSQYLRKAHSMYGWDWGPQLPDVGIWREIELLSIDTAKLGKTAVRQKHEIVAPGAAKTAGGRGAASAAWGENVRGDGSVVSRVMLSFDTPVEGDADAVKVVYEVIDPDGNAAAMTEPGEKSAVIENPRLWWPRGYGEQNQYTVKVLLFGADGDLLDMEIIGVGLRTLTVSREKDQWGEEFAVTVNGLKVFTKGANYIPDDAIYSRITEDVLRRDIQAACFANFNALRVWGGGYYPSEAFFDFCDEAGILIWQDLMFACNVYDLTDDFVAEITAEAHENVRRIANHPSLAVISGNNEMESAWLEWEETKHHSDLLRGMYIHQFEEILKDVSKEEAPDTFYWSSSPCSGGWFDDPSDENRGDQHYWSVWHGQLPFSEYRKHYFRFLSEFGFQSLPSMKTIGTFAHGDDLNIFSRVMESHQKNPSANGKIMYYLSETFRMPGSLEGISYLSQVLQGIAMKSAVDHLRANRGRCMGAMYWQFNDNWPVSSWSSMDYFGRYKALHYMARRFYAPVAASLQADGLKMSLYLANETAEKLSVHVKLQLRTLDFETVDEFETDAVAEPWSGTLLAEQDYSGRIAPMHPIEMAVLPEDSCEAGRVSRDDCFVWAAVTFAGADGVERTLTECETFVPVKYLNLRDPQISVSKAANGDLTLCAASYAPYVMAEGIEDDVVWDDNVISIGDTKPVTLHRVKGDPAAEVKIFDIRRTY